MTRLLLPSLLALAGACNVTSFTPNESYCGFNGGAHDAFGAFGRDIFNLHAALGAGDDHDPLTGTVEHETKIDLAVDRHRRFDIDTVNAFAFGAGLMGDQFLAEHFFAGRLNFVIIVTQLDAARLATAPSMHLRFDHRQRGVMVALQAKDAAQVQRLYDIALANGGSDEGAPGPRGDDGFYAGYFRDPDGNKLNVFTMTS